MKTVSVALVLCLNVGVDPPDVVKISPCARLECWIGKTWIQLKEAHVNLACMLLQLLFVHTKLCMGTHAVLMINDTHLVCV